MELRNAETPVISTHLAASYNHGGINSGCNDSTTHTRTPVTKGKPLSIQARDVAIIGISNLKENVVVRCSQL
jgi:hypothetical protein